MKAIILCGGQGTRLRPYTYSIPKPMLPVGKRPIIEYVLRNLKANGVTEAYLTVGYLGDVIERHFASGSYMGMKIHVVKEETEMGTAGSILPLREKMKDTFIVQMGDHLSRIDSKKMLQFHKKQGGIATLGFKRQGVPLEYGIAHVDAQGHVSDFREKPTLENLINAGVYIFEPKIFDYIKERDDFAKGVFPRLMEAGHKINAHIFDEYWLDIGRVNDYEKMNEFISIIEMVTDLEK